MRRRRMPGEAANLVVEQRQIVCASPAAMRKMGSDEGEMGSMSSSPRTSRDSEPPSGTSDCMPCLAFGRALVGAML